MIYQVKCTNEYTCDSPVSVEKKGIGMDNEIICKYEAGILSYLSTVQWKDNKDTIPEEITMNSKKMDIKNENGNMTYVIFYLLGYKHL